MHNAIVIALGKAKPKGGAVSDDSSGALPEESIELDEDENAAAKLAFDAKTPEEYGKALKALFCLFESKEHEEEEY